MFAAKGYYFRVGKRVFFSFVFNVRDMVTETAKCQRCRRSNDNRRHILCFDCCSDPRSSPRSAANAATYAQRTTGTYCLHLFIFSFFLSEKSYIIPNPCLSLYFLLTLICISSPPPHTHSFKSIGLCVDISMRKRGRLPEETEGALSDVFS